MRLLRFARNDENSRIPYRDPQLKPEDDIVGNFRIPKTRIPTKFPRLILYTRLEARLDFS